MDKQSLQLLVDSLEENTLYKVCIVKIEHTYVSKPKTYPILEEVNSSIETVGYNIMHLWAKEQQETTIIDEFSNWYE